MPVDNSTSEDLMMLVIPVASCDRTCCQSENSMLPLLLVSELETTAEKFVEVITKDTNVIIP
jgi:hypothetical protein